MGERREPIKDFRALGERFGLQAPQGPTAAPKPRGEDFYSLPILDRLRICDSSRRVGPRHDRRERTVATIGDVVKMDKAERDKLGIQVFAYGDLNEGQLVKEDPLLSSANVTVLFPANFKGNFRIINCADRYLIDDEKISLDQIVSQVDEVRQETILNRQNRMRMNIKTLDTHISHQKKVSGGQRYGLDYAPLQRQVTSRTVTQEMERLNRLKSIAIWDFLRISLEIEAQYPYLQPIFVPTDTGGGTHINLAMWSPSDKNTLRKVIDHDAPMQVVDDMTRPYDTNISKVSLREAHEKFLIESGQSPRHVVAGYHTFELFLRKDIMERQRETDHQAGSSGKPDPRDILPDMTDFLRLTAGQQLRRAHKAIGNASKRDHLARERANIERNFAIKSALNLSPQERRRQGIDILVVAPLDESGTLKIDDPECTEYNVFVTFDSRDGKRYINSGRTSIALLGRHYDGTNPGDVEEMAALDGIVQKERLVGETVFDKYSRYLREIRMLGIGTNILAKKRKAIPDADTASIAEMTQKIDELGSKKTIMTLSAWELAEEIQGENANMNLVSADSQTEHGITIIDIHLHEVFMGNKLEWLLNPKNERVFSKSRNSQHVWFQKQYLRGLKNEFAAGDETETNGAAAILVEKLQGMGIEV